MCQYSVASDGPDVGPPTAWHQVHLDSWAVGGVGMVIVEATGVNPEGRISANDLGIWNDRQRDAFRPITTFIREQGAVGAIQLGHTGRCSRACEHRPYEIGRHIGRRSDPPSAFIPKAKPPGKVPLRA